MYNILIVLKNNLKDYFYLLLIRKFDFKWIIHFLIDSNYKGFFFKSVILSLIIISSVRLSSQENNGSNIDFLNKNKAYINEKKDKNNKSDTTERKSEPDFIKNGREEKFFFLGASGGSPGSLNLNAGYYFDKYVVRGSGMYFNPNWNGGQIDLGYSIYKTPYVIYGVSLVGGAFRVNPFDPQIDQGGQNQYKRSNFPGYENQPQTFSDTIIRGEIARVNPEAAIFLDYYYRNRQEAKFSQNYIGGAFDFYLGGFWFQLGMGVGKGDYRNPQLLIQLGYLLDFGKKDQP
jgi:uncharacterized protein YxeA